MCRPWDFNATGHGFNSYPNQAAQLFFLVKVMNPKVLPDCTESGSIGPQNVQHLDISVGSFLSSNVFLYKNMAGTSNLYRAYYMVQWSDV